MAFTETLTGILAISSPLSAMLGSITWHLRIGWSLTVTSLFDLKMTCTAVCLSCGANVPFDGITENRLVTFGFDGSQFSKRKLEKKIKYCYYKSIVNLYKTRYFQVHFYSICNCRTASQMRVWTLSAALHCYFEQNLCTGWFQKKWFYKVQSFLHHRTKINLYTLLFHYIA